MKDTSATARAAISRLLRFLFWYGAAVGGLFYLLPLAGLLLQSSYEALDGSVRLLAVIGFIAVVAAWQVAAVRDRWRRTSKVSEAN